MLSLSTSARRYTDQNPKVCPYPTKGQARGSSGEDLPKPQGNLPPTWWTHGERQGHGQVHREPQGRLPSATKTIGVAQNHERFLVGLLSSLGHGLAATVGWMILASPRLSEERSPHPHGQSEIRREKDRRGGKSGPGAKPEGHSQMHGSPGLNERITSPRPSTHPHPTPPRSPSPQTEGEEKSPRPKKKPGGHREPHRQRDTPVQEITCDRASQDQQGLDE